MEIILLEDVKSLGKKGDMVNVSEGYARNFLLKKKMGVEATAKNKNDLKLQKQHEEKVAKEKLEEAKAFAEELKEKSITVSIKTGSGGRSFGSVSTKSLPPLQKSSSATIWIRKRWFLTCRLRARGFLPCRLNCIQRLPVNLK